MRLDEVIQGIANKRNRAKFVRMPKTSYPAIINALADAKFITEAARKASLELNAIFMSYKPRNRTIPDHAVGAMEVLDAQLQNEIRAVVPTEVPSLFFPAGVDINAPAGS